MRTIALVALVLLGLASTLFAAMPQTISYQGYLRNADGTTAAGPVSMVFSLYSSNPARNNPVWRETQTSVPLTNGIFSVQLGSVTPIAAPFNVPYWLGLKVGADPEMTPLQPLASVGYALRAATVEIVPCVPGDFLNCYTGPAGTMGVGVCKPGIRTCSPAGTFGDCLGQVLPSAEVCGDGLDNNCDGVVDEGCPTCTDGTRNGNETDVDCGGGTCPPCATGKLCLRGTDCTSSVCINGLCAASSCTDTVKNGNETDVDCGGGTCPPCATGRQCLQNADCANVKNGTSACINGTCGFGTCNAGYADCNSDPADGCETNLNTDNNNCGACGHVCPWYSPTCNAGTCG